MSQVSLQQAMELATAHHRAGRLAEAEGIYRQILSAAPHQPDALHLLGLVVYQKGQMDEGRELIEQAIGLQPAAAHFHANLGLVLMGLGRVPEAMGAYERALSLHADFPQAREGLGRAWGKSGQMLHDGGKIQEAIEAYRKALELVPDDVEMLNNLAAGLMDLGQPAEAPEPLERALALRPDYGEAQVNLGTALKDLLRLDEAMEAYRSAAERYPDWYAPQYSMGMLMLLRGEMPQGWALLESRWSEPEMVKFRQSYMQPQWRGEELAGRTIILHGEQGFGDAIQFIRYVPQVVQRGGRVIMACQPELLRLFRGSVKEVAQWITPGEKIPTYDVHCSLMSLPMIFQTSIETIPRDVPYLSAGEQLPKEWKQRIEAIGMGMKLGICWAGRPTHRLDRSRSIASEMYAPLSRVAGVKLVSLQVGRASDLKFEISDFTSELTDLAETAGLIENLDLVITVDTAIAHLAGALGRPVWVLLPFSPDWRWMLEREDSPWYPTMRLFRQRAIGDWNEVIGRVGEALRKEVTR